VSPTSVPSMWPCVKAESAFVKLRKVILARGARTLPSTLLPERSSVVAW